jgi:hypothetical protein
MGWSEAYNFNIDDSISISKAISLREKKDPRAGDLHCHKSCYQSKEGSRLLTRKASIDHETGKIKKKAHFAKWPSKYEGTELFCGFATIADSKRESMDYSMYFHKFDQYLRSLTQNIEPYFIESVSKNDGQFEPDFEISHSQKILGEISLTDVHIIDENKRKKKIYPKSYIDGNKFVISIRISEYITKQLLDFSRGGIDRLKIEWDYLVNQLDEQIENNVQMNNYDENLLKEISTMIDEMKNEEKERFFDPWNQFKIELNLDSLENDDYETLISKERRLYSFLEDRKLIHRKEKRFNNIFWGYKNHRTLTRKIKPLHWEDYNRLIKKDLLKNMLDENNVRISHKSSSQFDLEKLIDISDMKKIVLDVNTKKSEPSN